MVNTNVQRGTWKFFKIRYDYQLEVRLIDNDNDGTSREFGPDGPATGIRNPVSTCFVAVLMLPSLSLYLLHFFHLPFTCQVIVQPSNRRAFPMEEYSRCGAMIQEDLNEASLILGVKQVRHQ